MPLQNACSRTKTFSKCQVKSMIDRKLSSLTINNMGSVKMTKRNRTFCAQLVRAGLVSWCALAFAVFAKSIASVPSGSLYRGTLLVVMPCAEGLVIVSDRLLSSHTTNEKLQTNKITDVNGRAVMLRKRLRSGQFRRRKPQNTLLCERCGC